MCLFFEKRLHNLNVPLQRLLGLLMLFHEKYVFKNKYIFWSIYSSETLNISDLKVIVIFYWGNETDRDQAMKNGI